MKAEKLDHFYLELQRFVHSFERKIHKDRHRKRKKTGDVYTPPNVINHIIRNLFQIIFSDYGIKTFDFELKKRTQITKSQKQNFFHYLEKLKVLDPACGSGRWLVAICELLFQLYQTFSAEKIENLLQLRKKIVQHNIYGTDIEETACIISKLNLLLWVYKDHKEILVNDSPETISFKQIRNLLQQHQENNLHLNISNRDFLLEGYNELGSKSQNFDLIIGNPPYIENKSISKDYKKKLYEKFHSAYKLFDLSLPFIEKSLQLLEPKGYLSFLITNKFLSADYGIKIRNFLLNNSKIREIIDVSHIGVFKKAATYPIILNIQKSSLNKQHHHDPQIKIKNAANLDKLLNNDVSITEYPQEIINRFPSHVISTSKNISLVSKIYEKYDPIESAYNDLKITYRPFGFTKWKKHFDNISEQKSHDQDLILIGTGNLAPYTIKFEKNIRIAGHNISVSYFNFHKTFLKEFTLLSREKLIFREIAKSLSFVYDPGLFLNITGLYFFQIPSLNTSELFALLAVMNSKLLNLIFNALFGSLHMSSGYLRYNGSFIKRLPVPHQLTKNLSKLGKINQFLSQLQYNISHNKTGNHDFKLTRKSLNDYKSFFLNLTDAMVILNYFPNKGNIYENLKNLSHSETSFRNFSNFPFKFIIPRFNLSSYQVYETKQFLSIIDQIKNSYLSLKNRKTLCEEMEKLLVSFEF